jgi:predicted metalloprotease with PDZ domain
MIPLVLLLFHFDKTNFEKLMTSYVKKLYLLVIFLFHSLSLSAMENPPLVACEDVPTVTYRLQPVLEENNFFLLVTMTFPGEETGQTPVLFPSEWGGCDYTPQIDYIGSKATTVLGEPKPNVKVISYAPGTQVELQYKILPQVARPNNLVNSAVITPNLIHIPGYGLFALPWLQNVKHVNISLAWEGFSPTSQIATSFGIGANQTFRGSQKDQHSLFVAGDIRLYSRLVGANKAHFSFSGAFGFEDEALVEQLMGIIVSQRSFFKDDDFPDFFSSFIEGAKGYSLGGTRLNNALSCCIAREDPMQKILLLFAHEHFHNWTGGKIKIGDAEALSYWWSEGFTDYYCRVLELRSGRLTVRDFIDECNNILNANYYSLFVNEPNVSIGSDYWNDPQMQRLPYNRGFAFALYLNGRIKVSTGNAFSLDDVMRNLFDRVKVTQEVFSPQLFNELVGRYIEGGIQSELERFIDNGELVDFSGLAQSGLPVKVVHGSNSYPSGVVRKMLTPPYLYEIHSIDPMSQAFLAGLRQGDKIVEAVVRQSCEFLPDEEMFTVRLERGIVISVLEKKRQKLFTLIEDTSEAHDDVLTWFGAL